MVNGEELRRLMSIHDRTQIETPSSGALIPFAQNDGHALFANQSRKHEREREMQDLAQYIQEHEKTVKFLETLMIKLDEFISDAQVHLEHLDTNLARDKENAYKETIQNILKYDKSPAAFLCGLTDIPEYPFMKDVIGIVATLGHVEDPKLSRMLSEYLGIETMLGVVCKTYKSAKSVEAFTKGGLLHTSLGFPPNTDSTGNVGFRAFCLEYLRPYTGRLIANDPQKKLDIPNPRLANKETPPGFLGFAVNMVYVDYSNLHCVVKAERSLRETLFYNLFSTLQVYEREEDMMKAIPLITTGAISLDGGIMRSPGSFVLGHQRQLKVDVKFPRVPKNVPGSYLEIQERMQDATWMKDRTVEGLQSEHELLEDARLSYESKEAEMELDEFDFTDFLVDN